MFEVIYKHTLCAIVQSGKSLIDFFYLTGNNSIFAPVSLPQSSEYRNTITCFI